MASKSSRLTQKDRKELFQIADSLRRIVLEELERKELGHIHMAQLTNCALSLEGLARNAYWPHLKKKLPGAQKEEE